MSDSTEGKDIDLVKDATDWLDSLPPVIQTHSDECHKWHARCLVRRLVEQIDTLGATIIQLEERIRQLSEAPPTLPVSPVDIDLRNNLRVLRDRESGALVRLTHAERFVLREVMETYASEDDVACNEIAAVIHGLLCKGGPSDGKPVAWVAWFEGEDSPDPDFTFSTPERAERWCGPRGATPTPLYRSPSLTGGTERTPNPPSTPGEGTSQAGCTLTDAEREAIEVAVEYVGSAYAVEHHAATLRGLLARIGSLGGRETGQ